MSCSYVVAFARRSFTRLFTVLYFSVRSPEIERFVLRAAILHECQNYLLGGGGPSPPPSRAIIPNTHPLGTFENQDTRDGKPRYI